MAMMALAMMAMVVVAKMVTIMVHLAAVILPLFGCSGHPTAYWMQRSSYRLKVEVVLGERALLMDLS